MPVDPSAKLTGINKFHVEGDCHCFRKVIRKCMVHYLNKDVPSSSELRKCLSLAFGKYYISIPRPQLRHNNLRE